MVMRVTEVKEGTEIGTLSPEPHDPSFNGVELQLPNGKRIVMRSPGIGLMPIVAKFMRDDPGNSIYMAYLKALFYIAEINGQKVLIPQNQVELQKLANELGDVGEDIVLGAFMTYWPPLTIDDLPVIRKSL